MRTQGVVTLLDDFSVQAQHWAALTHREVPAFLTEALALLLTPIGTPPVDAPPVAALSDTEVLALTQVQTLPSRGIALTNSLPSRGKESSRRRSSRSSWG